MLNACVLILGGIVRLLVIRYIPLQQQGDFAENYTIAKLMINGATKNEWQYYLLFPEKLVYPFIFLKPVMMCFGDNLEIALYANLVYSMLGVLLAGDVARRISGRLTSTLTIFLLSFWPSHVLSANLVTSDAAMLLLLLGAVDIIAIVFNRKEKSLYDVKPTGILKMLVLLGIVLSIASSIQISALFLLLIYCVMQLFVTVDPTNKIRLDGSRYVVSQPLVCIIVVLICYTVMNFAMGQMLYKITGEKITSGFTIPGYNLMVGLNNESKGQWNEEDNVFLTETYAETESVPMTQQACMDVAIQRLQMGSDNVINLMTEKFCKVWSTDDFAIDWILYYAGQQNTLTPELQSLLEEIRPLGRVMYMALLLFAAIGCMEAWRRRWAPPPMVLVCMLFFLGTALSHMLLETQVRYHYNMIPFLILLASWTISNWGMFPQEKEKLRVVYQDRTVESGPEKDHTRFDMAKALADGHIFVSTTQNVADQAKADAAAKAAEEAVAEETPDAEPETSTEEPTEEAVTEAEETEEVVTEDATEEVTAESEEDAETVEAVEFDETADDEQPAIEPEDVSEEADASEEASSEQPETNPDNEATEITEVEEVVEENADAEGITKIELPASWQKDETVDTTIEREKLTTAADEAEKVGKINLLVSWKKKDEAADESENVADEPEIVSEAEAEVEAEDEPETEAEVAAEVEPAVEAEVEAEDEPETATLMLAVYEKVGENKSVQIYKNKAFPLVEGTWQIAGNTGRKPPNHSASQIFRTNWEKNSKN